jgi:hypothetical protein
MTQADLALRCPACGSDAAIDIAAGFATCQHCHTRQPVVPDLLVRLRAHLAAIAEYRSEWSRAAADQDEASRLTARFAMPFVLRVFFPLAAGMATVVSLGIGVSTLMLLMDPFQRLLGQEPGGVLASLIGLGVHASLLLALRQTIVRRRKAAASWDIAPRHSQRCPTCGGTFPLAGPTPACPFCRSALVISASDARWMESEAERAVRAMQRKATAATKKAAESGAATAQAIIEMVTFATLLPMTVAIPFVAGAMGVRWFVRNVLADFGIGPNATDVAGMVVGGLFTVVAIAAAIMVGVRRERRRAARGGA